MIPAALTRWLWAALIAAGCSTSYLLDTDPEALQLVADDKATVIHEAQRLARMDDALTAIGEQQP